MLPLPPVEEALTEVGRHPKRTGTKLRKRSRMKLALKYRTNGTRREI
jgi:hypothetical protein